MTLYRDMEQEVTLHWCPAHVGVPGNELADVAAKEATGWRPKPVRSGPAAPTPSGLMILIFTVRFRAKVATQKQWNYEWDVCITGAVTKNLIKKPHKKILIKYEGLRRAEASVLIQFRTRKIAFQSYLHGIETSDIKRCQCGDVENKMHVLLQCLRWASLKNKYFGIERDLRKLLDNNAFIKKIITFILDTKLLSQFRLVETSAHVFDEENKENQPSGSAAMDS